MASKLSALIGALAGKNPPVDADKLPVLDSAASGNFQWVTWANVKSAMTARPRTLVLNTGAATPAATDSGKVYTNEGDANGSSITLPTAAAGLIFTVIVQAAQTLTVTAGAGDTIRIATSVTAAAGSISASAIGCSITLVAINETEWIATASVGSWTI